MVFKILNRFGFTSSPDEIVIMGGQNVLPLPEIRDGSEVPISRLIQDGGKPKVFGNRS